MNLAKMNASLHVHRLGERSPTLVLLHGLSANGEVWAGVLERLAGWPGRIVVPDLRGHGRSPHARTYAEVDHAADVAVLLRQGGDTYVVGHSMGGMVALALSSGAFRLRIRGVFAFGVKTGWNEAELAKLKAFADKPTRHFASRSEAADRFILGAGLAGLADGHAAVVDAGIVRDGAGYRLAADPRTVLVAGASVAAAFNASQAPKRLACGRQDKLVTIDQLRAIDPDAIDLGDCGHNVHVEDPDRLCDAIPFLKAFAARP